MCKRITQLKSELEKPLMEIEAIEWELIELYQLELPAHTEDILDITQKAIHHDRGW